MVTGEKDRVGRKGRESERESERERVAEIKREIGGVLNAWHGVVPGTRRNYARSSSERSIRR